MPTVVSLAVTACGGSVPPQQQSYSLEPAAQPFLDDEPYELGAQDTCRWLEDGRLFIETASVYADIRAVTRYWIDFAGASLPLVEVASWNESVDSRARWDRRDFRGRAWVSSDGTGLGEADGPDLILETQWISWISGSDQPGGRRLVVRARDLPRRP